MSGTFNGTTPNPVQAGTSLVINFYDPGRAGQTITAKAVKLSNGSEIDIPIILDPDGVGGVKWTVPANWGDLFLVLQESGAPDFTVTVT